MTSQADTRPAALIDYGPQIETELAWLIAQVERFDAICTTFPVRWLALQLLEQDEALKRQLSSMAGGDDVLAASRQSLDRLAQTFDEDVDTWIAERRYRWINEVVGQTVEKPAADGLTRSDKVDRIVTHKVWGIPIFLVVMWTAFKLTTEVSVPYLNWIDALISGPLSRWTAALMGALAEGSDLLELAHPVVSNLCCLTPRAGEAGDIAAALQLSGEAVCSTTRIGGREVLRAAIVNHRTTSEDIRLVVAAVEREVRARL